MRTKDKSEADTVMAMTIAVATGLQNAVESLEEDATAEAYASAIIPSRTA